VLKSHHLYFEMLHVVLHLVCRREGSSSSMLFTVNIIYIRLMKCSTPVACSSKVPDEGIHIYNGSSVLWDLFVYVNYKDR